MSILSSCSKALPSSFLRRGLASAAVAASVAVTLAACGGGGGGGGEAPGTQPSTTAPTQASDLARKFIGTWSGCLWVEQVEAGAAQNAWNRVTYTFTPAGGDLLKLASREERFENNDACDSGAPTGVRVETADIRLDGSTFTVADAGEDITADRMIFASTGLSSTGTIPLIRGGGLGIGLEVQLAAALTPEGLRVTPITGLSNPPTRFFQGVLNPVP